MRLTALVLLSLLAQDLPGAKPVSKPEWMKRHDGFKAEAAKGECDLLFLGDSITDGWRGQKAIFDAAFGAYKPLNFGISGDRTQHVLWRIQNGEMEGIKPKVVVLMIGTNNIGQAKDPEKPESAVAGIKAIVEDIHKKSAATRVLLLGVFPRDEKPDHPRRAMVKEINTAIAKLDDGGKTVQFLDIGEKFLEPDGTISKEIMKDFLHLTVKGYQLWADALKEPLAKLMK